MRVAVLNPSMFGFHYEVALCRGLARVGAEALLVGRPLRAGEGFRADTFAFEPHFYAAAERLPALFRPVFRYGKGVEHGAGLYTLPRLLRRHRIDVVHAQWLLVPLLDGLLLPRLKDGVRLVTTVHNSIIDPSFARLSGAAMGWALRRFDGLIVHTEQTRAYVLGLGVPEHKVRLLRHPPVPLDPDPAAIRDRAPAPPGTVRILQCGAIKPYKGLDVLVQAGLRLAARGLPFRIDVVGRPFMDIDDIRRQIAEAGADRFFHFDLRFVSDDDLAGYMSAADIVTFPYREVDASGVFGIATQFEKAVVATPVGNFGERPVRDFLRLVPPGDVAALAGALEELITQPEARSASRDRIRELRRVLPSWDDFARGCLEVYEGARSRPSEASRLERQSS